MDLIDRLNILKESGQITEETYEKLLKVIKIFEQKYKIILSEENGAMYITHLSAALTRMYKGEVIHEVSEEIYDEIKVNAHFTKSQEILNYIEESLKLNFAMGERGFIIAHICTVLTNK